LERYLYRKGVKILNLILDGKQYTLDPYKKSELIDEFYRPPIFSTTLWDYPKQSYGDTPKGNNKYAGVTPAFIIYNLIYRYTYPGDLVCDPMAGSGTTIDVCKEERRRVVAFDIVPTRSDIIQADARNIPLEDNSVDMVFIDSPYGDNIRYNDHPLNIGHIPASEERFYDELEKVMVECHRILKDGKILAWLIGVQWAKGVYIPVGFKVYERLVKYFEPVDVICVARKNQYSNTPFWHSKALQHNFYLRGFKHLIIVRKSDKKRIPEDLKINWRYYERAKKKD
jgi:DNA modification methylase